MIIDTNKGLGAFAKAFKALAIELRTEMIEDSAESKEDQIQFLKEVVDDAFGKGNYAELAAAAALLFEIQG